MSASGIPVWKQMDPTRGLPAEWRTLWVDGGLEPYATTEIAVEDGDGLRAVRCEVWAVGGVPVLAAEPETGRWYRCFVDGVPVRAAGI